MNEVDTGSDRRLALGLGALLFVVTAWPLLFLHVPPYQDLPGHLAAVTILANPEKYPELVATGFLKPNSLFFLFVLHAGKAVGFVPAAKLFVAGVLAANAFVFPRFVLAFSDRKRMVLAAPLLVPMVHNWFVSMGMLNFAASVPAALLLLMELHGPRASTFGMPHIGAPTFGMPHVGAGRGKGRAAALALLTWYLHPFAIVVVGVVVAAALVAPDWRARVRAWIPPLLPAGVLAAIVLVRHAAVAAPRMDSPVYATLGWSLYDLWAHFFYGFTELTAVSLVPAAVLAIGAALRWREAPALLGPLPTLALLGAYLFGPYVAFDANYITPRIVPFLWAAALVRLPSSLPRLAHVAVIASAAVYLVGMPIDLLRLSRELDAFAAGTVAVPDGARLLPLSFNARPTSKNTFSLGTAWGLYVLERHTSAVDAWANVPSMPVMLRAPLPTRLEPMMRLRFIKNAGRRDAFCSARRASGFSGTADECSALWRGEWDRFWGEALPGFDHVLLWDPPPEVVETVPPEFAPSFTQGRLHLYARVWGGAPR